MEKSKGLNKSEAFVARLCEETYLYPWCYPNLYKAPAESTKHPKTDELCDLLIVCGNIVIIFSIKEAKLENSNGKDVNWKRWMKNAVFKSRDQLFGAERWIRNFAERISHDPHGKEKFILDIPKNEIRIFRIAVSLGASNCIKSHFGQNASGSVMVNTSLKGKKAHLDQSSPYIPFSLGDVSEDCRFIHVLNDETFFRIVQNLDTVTDLSDYLHQKENLVKKYNLTTTGEEEILFYYLRRVINGRSCNLIDVFRNNSKKTLRNIYLSEGGWFDFENSKKMNERYCQ